MRTELESCEAVIKTLSKKYKRFLPEDSIFEVEDLISEGWEVYMSCKKHYDEKHKTTFVTYLYYSVARRFNTIVIRETRRVRNGVLFINDAFGSVDNWLDSVKCCEAEQERLCMVKEAIHAISEVSSGFADMITEGVSKELLTIARRNLRSKVYNSGGKLSNSNYKLAFSKSLLTIFFIVDLKKIKELLYNYI